MLNDRLASAMTSANDDAIADFGAARFASGALGLSAATITFRLAVPGSLVRTMVPLLATVPKICACAVHDHTEPNPAHAATSAVPNTDEGRLCIFLASCICIVVAGTSDRQWGDLLHFDTASGTLRGDAKLLQKKSPVIPGRRAKLTILTRNSWFLLTARAVAE